MRIALVTPPYNLLEEGYGTKKYSKYSAYPPLGLGYIAAALENAEIDVMLIDSQAELLNKEQIVMKVAEFHADAVGISAVTACADSACDLATLIKDKLQTIVFMGGPHPTCFPDTVYRNVKNIDFLVLGEGEITVLEILKVIDDKDKWHAIDGISFVDQDKKLVHTKNRSAIDDLDLILPPARHLYNHSLYHPIPNLYRQLPATNMITSRGCPYGKCAFCYEAGKAGQQYRRHSPERIISEIKDLIKAYGIREIAFWDDNFVVNHEWVKKFCSMLIEERLNITWSCYSRVDQVNKEILGVLAKAGCWSIFYGLESGVQKLLDIVDKGITLAQSESAIRLTHEAGIETRGSFMLALPGEDPGLAKQTIDFAIKLNLDSVQFLATYPEYGTKLYEKAMPTGKFMKYHGRHGVTYVPDGYKDAPEVKRMITYAYTRFYLRPKFFYKYLKKIRNVNDFLKFLEGFKMILGIVHNK